MPAEIIIRDIEKLVLNKGDVLVVTLPGEETLKQAANIHECLVEVLRRAGHVDVPILFKAPNIAFSILTPEPKETDDGNNRNAAP